MTLISRYSDLAAGNLVVETDYGCDGIGRLTGMSHGNSSSTLVDYDWVFDLTSRITQFVSSIDGTSDYDYDNIHQLVALTTRPSRTNRTCTTKKAIGLSERKGTKFRFGCLE